MIVYLYDCSCDNHRVDKSAYLTQLLTLNGTMREEQDISNPSIVLELSVATEGVVTNDLEDVVTEDEDEVIVNPDSIPVFNYVFIPSLRRYYFVTAMSALPSAKGLYRLFRVSLRCDVLMSFKNDFIDLVAMVERNEFKYDPAIKDLAHPFKDSVAKDIYYLQNDSLFQIDQETYALKNVAVTIYQKNYNIIADTELQPYSQDLLYDLLGRKVTPPGEVDTIRGVFTANASPSIRTITYIMEMGVYYNFIKRVPENQKTFIKAVNAFPFDLERVCNISDYEVLPACGDEALSDEFTLKFSKTNEYSKYVWLGSYDFPEYDFIYDNPISSWVLYVPFMGRRELDYSLYAGKTINFYMIFSLADNSATLYLMDSEGNRVESCDFTLGHRIGVDSSNAQEVRNNQISMALNGIIGTMGNIIAIGAGIVTENPFMVAKGVTSQAGLITNTITQSLNNLPQGRTSQQSSSMAMTSPMTAYIERVHKEDVLTSTLLKEEYAHIYGLPLNKPYRLSNLTGFTKVAEIHLEGLKCTEPEKESIYNALRSGVIL